MTDTRKVAQKDRREGQTERQRQTWKERQTHRNKGRKPLDLICGPLHAKDMSPIAVVIPFIGHCPSHLSQGGHPLWGV